MENAQLLEQEIEQEAQLVNDNDFKVSSFIRTLFSRKELVDGTHESASDSEFEETPRNSGLKRPRNNLPRFSGNYAEWTPFADLFQSTVN